MPRTSDGIEHDLRHNVGLKQPWVVRWWPNGRLNRGGKLNRGDGQGGQVSEGRRCSCGFATPALRAVFIKNGFRHEAIQQKVAGKGRKRADEDREQRENPETWPDELGEVMAKVTEIRSRSGRRYNLLSDVYRAMKDLGFKREREA